jgi:hypothetical protein
MEKYILQNFHGTGFLKSINKDKVMSFVSDRKEAMVIVCDEQTSKELFKAINLYMGHTSLYFIDVSEKASDRPY